MLLDLPQIGLAGIIALVTLGVLVVLNIRARLKALASGVRRAGRGEDSSRSLRQRLRELEGELASVQHERDRLDDLTSASFRQSIRQYIRVVRAEHKLKDPHRSAALQLPHKLRNLEFAASHGVGVPTAYQVWPDIASIDLGALPETFVLKSDGGAGSVAVFPLQRLDDDRYGVIGGKAEYTESELLGHLRSLGRRARAPYFAEELLVAADRAPLPDDVKCYMFYGEVGQILVRKVGEHGDPSTIRLKFVNEQGKDYGPVAVGRTHDETIQVPNSLPEISTAAKHLSRAIGLPFCRVDLYNTSRGIVLGEITRAPSGGNEYFVEDHDEMLGWQWVRASARLEVDLNSGRPAGPVFGTAADLRLYPPSDDPLSPANFGRTTVDCTQWCE
ncbi:ATP-grasp fold amidoligase family protein [Ruania zhangjianzhongii]|uniref:ATP-grasp fold amidoligase family protein n=1 Tax=Ruania zhangjianzhongii TaxID=2603206 RepID=UPI00143CC59E|nr:ATP-grasp fold amidoligase family protein [Ruania zhangjianzhongii]